LKRAFTGQLEHRKVEVWCLKVGNARKEMESINMNHTSTRKNLWIKWIIRNLKNLKISGHFLDDGRSQLAEILLQCLPLAAQITEIPDQAHPIFPGIFAFVYLKKAVLK
jgi:hypothetical protein